MSIGLTCRFLGVIVDDELHWTPDIETVFQKLDSLEIRQAHTMWVDFEKPRNGLINKLRLQAKYNYKRAFKQAAHIFEWDVDDDLPQLYLRKEILEELAFSFFQT